MPARPPAVSATGSHTPDPSSAAPSPASGRHTLCAIDSTPLRCAAFAAGCRGRLSVSPVPPSICRNNSQSAPFRVRNPPGTPTAQPFYPTFRRAALWIAPQFLSRIWIARVCFSPRLQSNIKIFLTYLIANFSGYNFFACWPL